MSGIIGGAGSKSGVIGETELDYEEGTFTPTWQTTGVSSTISYHTQNGHYVKVGNVVTCWGVISTNTTTWVGTYVQLGGLPISASGTQITGFITQSYSFTGQVPTSMSYAAHDRMYLYYRDASAGDVGPLYANDMRSSGTGINYIEYCVIYKI